MSYPNFSEKKPKKTMIMISCIVILGATINASPAQDYSLSPIYGQTRLSAGFMPDPYNVSMTAGGANNVASRVNGCAGYVANAPDFRLNWSGGGPLIISVDSGSDTTLVVNTPNGNWYCDDDSGSDRWHNPSIRFGNPLSGQYDIWVGTFHGDYVDATLSISEIRSR